MGRVERALRLSALVCGASAWAAAFACVPPYTFAPDDAGAPADAAPPPPPDAPSPDAAEAADAGSDAPFRAQLFVKPNDLGGGEEGAVCALRNGALYCWGNNDANAWGALGFQPIDAGSNNPFLHPMQVTTKNTPTQVVLGQNHTCSLYGRSAWCRGANDSSQLANASVGGSTPDEVPVNNLPDVDVLAASFETTCALVLDGYDAGSDISNVWCWGNNRAGTCGRPLDDTRDYQKAWPLTGEIDGGPTGRITDAVAIAGGGAHFCVLTARRTIECWGGNDSFESGPVMGPLCPNNAGHCSPQPQEVTLPNGDVPTELALGDGFSCALAKSGSVYCWGNNEYDQLGNGGAATQTCQDATGTQTWQCNSSPTRVVKLGPMQHVFAGGNNACAIDAAHHAYCWGNDYAGEYGNGTMNANDPFPHQIFDMSTSQPMVFDEMAMGGFKVCGRSGTTDYCWGGLDLGTQVGDAAPPPNGWPAPVQFP